MKDPKQKKVVDVPSPGENCPLCNSIFKARAIRNPFQKTDGPEYRDEYRCGAVILINRENPSGVLEARCCSGQHD